ncbi:ABC transporter permease [Cryptosporangium sp. NPDC051539]|uniref:ABC transporter permease n=1 Tax=Cryptosporangium sp. NPDC051539 TaxID=3363962 RepID=UPI0037990987
MSLAVEDRPLVLGTGHGGLAARRAVVRWAWRLFRREWRQQLLVLALLLTAVAATTVGLGIGANATSEGAIFGRANYRLTLAGAPAAKDLAKLRQSFGTIEVIEHGKRIPAPGSANGVDLRAQDPAGPFGRTTLRLVSGRWPRGADEVAVTERVATILGLHVGKIWHQDGITRQVVGLVENPLDLRDAFALAAPGHVAAPDHVDVLLRASRVDFFAKPRPSDTTVQERSGDDATTVPVLLLATIGLVFVGLLAVAGFTVMAQRRLRALGMLGAMGAAPRHIRLVLLAHGAVTGGVGALVGAAIGVGGWIVVAPRLEIPLGHRINRFDLPWAPIVFAVLLATVTAVAAAWWPARAVARSPIVAALYARPAPPRPARRFAVLGLAFLLAGLTALLLAEQKKPPFIIGGTVATAVALLLLAPMGVALIGRLAGSAPLAARLAMRDLARYQARSSAALAAITLAVGIAAVVALAAGVTAAKAAAPTGGNLPADQLIVRLSLESASGPVPVLTPTQTDAARKQADAIVDELHPTSTLLLTGAVFPDQPLERGGRYPAELAKPHRSGSEVEYSGRDSIPVYVATPEVLAHYGLDAVNPDADFLTSRANLAGYDLIPGRQRGWHPVVQHANLPSHDSLPTVLITARGMNANGMHLTTIPVGWLVKTRHALTQAQIDAVERKAAAAGLTIESRPTGADQTRLARGFTAAGIALALGVLATTVGLIRSETAGDLRTLTATGAPRRTRRAITAATAAALALSGAVLGTACAYLAMLAWYHREMHWLADPPTLDLIAILAGLPLIAYLGGRLLAGREPRVLTRRPAD